MAETTQHPESLYSSSVDPMHITSATAAEAAELAVLTRAGIPESRHLGSAVLIGPDGEVMQRFGSPESIMFPRSCLKPLQAIASLRVGALISPAAIALACGSHTGSRRHQELCAEVLKKEGLTETDLHCPTALPHRSEDLNIHLEADKGPTRLAFNCSGKHAAFLAAARTSGARLATYTHPDHPIQRQINEVYTEYCGEAPTAVGVDGCGAPAAAMSLTALARGMSRLGSSLRRRDAELHAFTVAQAMLDYPWAVHGHREANTVVMEKLGVLAKSGAEGVLVLAAPDGTSVAVKCLDGSARATHLVALSLLAARGVIDIDALSAVLPVVVPAITGGADHVTAGSLRLSAEITDAL